jgi:hypothetical protein
MHDARIEEDEYGTESSLEPPTDRPILQGAGRSNEYKPSLGAWLPFFSNRHAF